MEGHVSKLPRLWLGWAQLGWTGLRAALVAAVHPLLQPRFNSPAKCGRFLTMDCGAASMDCRSLSGNGLPRCFQSVRAVCDWKAIGRRESVGRCAHGPWLALRVFGEGC